ncbi:hypothetical protein BHE74_00022114 [Ensete ventricosum]|nr:hypothetical protein BHE74_00022114 [Ensete ventricosum]
MEAATPQPVCAKEALDLLNCAVDTPFGPRQVPPLPGRPQELRPRKGNLMILFIRLPVCFESDRSFSASHWVRAYVTDMPWCEVCHAHSVEQLAGSVGLN